MATQDIYKMGAVNLGGTPTTNTVSTQGNTSNVPTAEQNLAAYNASKNIGNQTITSNSLKTPTVVPLATPTTKTNYSSTIANTLADLTTQQNNAQAQVDAFNKQGKETSASVANLQSLLGGKGADTTKIYEEQGVNKVYNQIADLNAQATGLKNEALAIPIQIQNEFKGTGATDAGVAPIETSRLRDNALKALSLGQQAAIATAQYDKAKNYADQLIAAKYDQIEADINAKLTNLQSLKDFDLTPAQKKLADATTQRLKYEELQVQENKEKETAINNLLFNAYQQNAPKDLIAKAESAAKTGDIRQVASSLGAWGANYYQNEALKMELTKKKLENLQATGAGNAPVGSITKDLGITTDMFMQGIAGTESAGSRDAYGGTDPYKVLSGQKTIAEFNTMTQAEKDNTAYGKYQVMGFNIPKWTKEAFGTAMTIQEFLNSPEKQEALMKFKSEQEYAKYGNWDDVASVWFSGKPAAGNVRSDKFGTSVPTYITKYRNNLGLGTGTGGSFSAETIAYSNAIDKGQYKDINALPADAQKAVTLYRSSEAYKNKPKEVNPAQVSLLEEQLTNLNNATNLIGGFAGLGGANIAGANFLGRTDIGAFLSGDKAEALGYIDNILSGETLKKLIEAKAAGATFGALSNQELGLLERSANVLNKWAIRDPDTGELLGFKVSDEKVNEELQKLKDKILLGIGKNVIDENTTLADDIYNMQVKVTSSTPAINLFNK